MHVDRLMDVQDALRVSDFAVDRAQRQHDAAVGDGLAVNIRFMLVQVAAEQRVPEAGLGRERLVGGEALGVEDADVGFMEAAGLQSANSRVGVGGGVEYCN